MTPEEQFTRIENFMDTMAEHQARHDEDVIKTQWNCAPCRRA